MNKELITHSYLNVCSTLWQKDSELMNAVNEAVAGLDSGDLKVAYKIDSDWHVNEYLKQAILIYLKTMPSNVFKLGDAVAYDKVPLKYSFENVADSGVRVVPHATARFGSFIGSNTVLMPCFINIGAHVGENSMIDTWATIGSCANIGNNVHVSGGAGIGGVLEPVQARPTIIEDNCFIGARSEIVEGVIVRRGAVISMNVMLSQSTKIYDRVNDVMLQGEVPERAVVVPGSIPSDCGKYSLNAAIIVKYVDSKTTAKTSINELLRK